MISNLTFYTYQNMVWGPGGAALVLLLRGARHRDPVGWWLTGESGVGITVGAGFGCGGGTRSMDGDDPWTAERTVAITGRQNGRLPLGPSYAVQISSGRHAARVAILRTN